MTMTDEQIVIMLVMTMIWLMKMMMFMFIMGCKDVFGLMFFLMLSDAVVGYVLDNNNALDHDEDDDVHGGLQGCLWTNAFSC